MGVVAVLCVPLGVLAGLGPLPSLVMAALLALTVATAVTPDRVGRYSLILVLWMPVGYSVSGTLPTDVAIGGVTVSVAILVPVLVIALSCILGLVHGGFSERALPLEARVVVGAVVLWVAMCCFAALRGLQPNGVLPALRDLQYVALWGWVLVPLIAAIRGRPWGLNATLRSMVIGAGLYSATVVALYLGPSSLRVRVYQGSAMTGADRVLFGNGEVLTLVLPIVVYLIAANSSKVLGRLPLAFAAGLMVSALGISQTRTLLVAAFLNCVLSWVAVGRTGPSFARSRVITWCLVAVLAVAAMLSIASLAGVSRFTELPSTFGQRLTSLTSYSRDSSFNTRSNTIGAALDRWRTDVRSFAVGDGLGSEIVQYSPTGRIVGLQPMIDNVWATLALKGGVALLAPYALALLSLMWAFVRAARRAQNALEERLWWTIVVSVPLFVLSSSLFSAHLLNSPASVLAICSLAGLAVGACSRTETQHP